MKVRAVPRINRKSPIGGCNVHMPPDLYNAQDVIDETLPLLFPVLRRLGAITDRSHVLEDLMAHNEIKVGRAERQAVIEAPDFAIGMLPNRPKYTSLPAFNSPGIVTKIAQCFHIKTSSTTDRKYTNTLRDRIKAFQKRHRKGIHKIFIALVIFIKPVVHPILKCLLYFFSVPIIKAGIVYAEDPVSFYFDRQLARIAFSPIEIDRREAIRANKSLVWHLASSLSQFPIIPSPAV